MNHAKEKREQVWCIVFKIEDQMMDDSRSTINPMPPPTRFPGIMAVE